MLASLLGGLLGGAFRALPEILSFFDKSEERKHELLMQDKALEFEKLRGAQRMSEISAESESHWETGAIESLKESIKSQGEKTGIRWIDALSSSVRPMITYWQMFLYSLVKAAIFYTMLNNGLKVETAIISIWSEADMAILSSILNFWFLGRVFDKIRFQK